VLVLPCAPGLACPFFMFGQLWVAFGVAEAEGAAAVLADPVFAAVVPDAGDEVVDDVVDADVDEWLVAALATARLPPNPTPSAPAPTAVPMMIFPTLDLTCLPPSDWVLVLDSGHPRWLRAYCSDALSAV
jgi:hypothetical protein